MRFGNAGQSIAGFDKVNRRAGDVGRVDRRDGLFWNRDNRTWLHGEIGLGNGLLGGLRGRRVGNLCRGLDGLAGLGLLVSGLGFFADATFDQEADNDSHADNNGGDDGFLKSFPAALLDIQLKAGRNLKRVLRAHTLNAAAISIANANQLTMLCLWRGSATGCFVTYSMTYSRTVCLTFGKLTAAAAPPANSRQNRQARRLPYANARLENWQHWQHS